MPYSQFYLKRGRRVPWVVALLVIIAVTFLTIKISSISLTKNSRATSLVARRVEIANLTSTSATVYWIYKPKTTGWLIYGKGLGKKFDMTAGDDRDLNVKKNIYLNHYVTLKNLERDTEYCLKIISGTTIITKINGQPYCFKTLPETKDVSNLRPAFGRFIKPSGELINDAIVFMRIKDTYPLVTHTNKGSWVLPLNNLRSIDTNKLKIPADNEKITIEFLTESEKISVVTTELRNLNPIREPIIEGRNYDLSAVAGTDEGVLALADQVSERRMEDVSIIYPKENSIIPGVNPLMKGDAAPNENIKITLRGSQTSIPYFLRTDREGHWKLSLRNSLSPGNYLMTLIVKNQAGKEISKSRSFSISKSGESVLGEATPESTIVPSIATTPTSPPSLEPTTITASPIPPRTGNSINSIVLASVSLVVIGLGLLFTYGHY